MYNAFLSTDIHYIFMNVFSSARNQWVFQYIQGIYLLIYIIQIFASNEFDMWAARYEIKI